MNKRFEVRKARLTPIVVSHDTWPWPEVLVATDVSPRGLFISGDRLVDEGESVRVSFRLGTSELWEPEGYVVRSSWRRRFSDLRFSGFGVELFGVSSLERTMMRMLLRKVPPPLPLSCLRTGEGEQVKPTRRRRGRSGGRRRDDPQSAGARWGRLRRILTGVR